MEIKVKKNQLAIKSIKIEKLFGYYDYNLPFDTSSDISKLLIIYGDNGSGKTTLLKLIFWLVSSADRSGYKSKIASTKFKSIVITFENGIEIGAFRDNTLLIGDYNYFIKPKNKAIISILLEVTRGYSISLSPGSAKDDKFRKILSLIKEMNISIYYLSDDRKILNSLTSTDHEEEQYDTVIINETEGSFALDHPRGRIKRILNEKKLSLEPAIERLIDWIRTKTISSSKTGEKNSQVIFTELIRNIFKATEGDKVLKTKADILSEIEYIETNINPYIKYGLLDTFDSQTLKGTIKEAKTEDQLHYLITITTPYLDSIKAKLKALERLKDTLDLFVDSVNNYFSHKSLSFNLNSGFNLQQKINGEEISFSYLSSGEKQLMLLFINTITSTEEATIFVIDEPEISLNIKWQRNLIGTLLKFSIEKNIQYIISTHSLELLSSNLDQVTQLEDASLQKEV